MRPAGLTFSAPTIAQLYTSHSRPVRDHLTSRSAGNPRSPPGGRSEMTGNRQPRSWARRWRVSKKQLAAALQKRYHNAIQTLHRYVDQADLVSRSVTG